MLGARRSHSKERYCRVERPSFGDKVHAHRKSYSNRYHIEISLHKFYRENADMRKFYAPDHNDIYKAYDAIMGSHCMFSICVTGLKSSPARSFEGSSGTWGK
jgi:hypothetical protein